MAIDRERCILCYRCVRFSQEIAEDYQLVFLERGDHTFVGTHDGRPYVAPFSGNIIELCPVGALTSTAYRFRARPWDIEGSGTVCTLCPSQCNVELTVRDDAKVVRVLARDNEEVDDGWLCDKGRFGYQSFASPERITAPLVRDGGFLREVSWERALSDAAAPARARGRAHRRVGRRDRHQRGGLPRPAPAARGPRLGAASTRAGRSCRARTRAPSRAPTLSARGSPTSITPARSSCSTPSSSRRRRSSTCACARPSGATAPGSWSPPRARRRSTRTPRRRCASRRAPSRRPSEHWRRRSAARAPHGSLDDLAAKARASEGFRPGAPSANGSGPRSPADAVRAAADVLRDAGDVVVIWGERVASGERGAQARRGAAGARRLARRRRQGRVGADRRPRRHQRARPARGRLRGRHRAGPRRTPDAAEAPRGAPPCCCSRPSCPRPSSSATPAWSPSPRSATRRSTSTRTWSSPRPSTPRRRAPSPIPDGRIQRVRQALGHARRVAPRVVGARRPVRARRRRPGRAQRAAGDRGARRGGALLRGPHARRDRRPGRALAGARRRLGARRRRAARQSRWPTRRPLPTAYGWRSPRRSGTGPRSSTRPRCASWPPARAPSCRSRTPARLGVDSGDDVRVSVGADVGDGRRRACAPASRPAASSVSGGRLPEGEAELAPARQAVAVAAAGEAEA